uniref:Uncharacterized protein n=1 Tax=Chromera velia CCMP2878 TaxID=1169474 RepID=A0A0G4F5J8_9ALVE|eukprot:Cvel_15271.t1-p1 / transcript=Cvel_15271.t1 / gene=Cvel_15271 / organism=Chromera_velia_CCMP2878 / gene_product=hypothetical protein / transcript_product=hypothetical protein / location=Cvel_scaffold1120:2080-6012(-) / protein_length=657 / sequence_SO=supercontig / SO=protein_coding / is_pseudo=false
MVRAYRSVGMPCLAAGAVHSAVGMLEEMERGETCERPRREAVRHLHHMHIAASVSFDDGLERLRRMETERGIKRSASSVCALIGLATNEARPLREKLQTFIDLRESGAVNQEEEAVQAEAAVKSLCRKVRTCLCSMGEEVWEHRRTDDPLEEYMKYAYLLAEFAFNLGDLDWLDEINTALDAAGLPLDFRRMIVNAKVEAQRQKGGGQGESANGTSPEVPVHLGEVGSDGGVEWDRWNSKVGSEAVSEFPSLQRCLISFGAFALPDKFAHPERRFPRQMSPRFRALPGKTEKEDGEAVFPSAGRVDGESWLHSEASRVMRERERRPQGYFPDLLPLFEEKNKYKTKVELPPGVSVSPGSPPLPNIQEIQHAYWGTGRLEMEDTARRSSFDPCRLVWLDPERRLSRRSVFTMRLVGGSQMSEDWSWRLPPHKGVQVVGSEEDEEGEGLEKREGTLQGSESEQLLTESGREEEKNGEEESEGKEKRRIRFFKQPLHEGPLVAPYIERLMICAYVDVRSVSDLFLASSLHQALRVIGRWAVRSKEKGLSEIRRVNQRRIDVEGKEGRYAEEVCVEFDVRAIHTDNTGRKRQSRTSGAFKKGARRYRKTEEIVGKVLASHFGLPAGAFELPPRKTGRQRPGFFKIPSSAFDTWLAREIERR